MLISLVGQAATVRMRQASLGKFREIHSDCPKMLSKTGATMHSLPSLRGTRHEVWPVST